MTIKTTLQLLVRVDQEIEGKTIRTFGNEFKLSYPPGLEGLEGQIAVLAPVIDGVVAAATASLAGANGIRG